MYAEFDLFMLAQMFYTYFSFEMENEDTQQSQIFLKLLHKIISVVYFVYLLVL